MPQLTARHRAAGIISFEYVDRDNGTWLCVVDPNSVQVDPRFQREHDERHSAEMAAVDLPVVPYPICGYTNGIIDALDGQHRVEAAKKNQKRRIKVIIKPDLTLAQKAELYAELNQAKRPNKWNQFKARLTQRHPTFLAIARLCDHYGFSLKCHDQRADLRCTETIEDAHKIGILEPWLKVMSAFMVDGRLEKGASTSAIEFQRGIIDMIRTYGQAAMTNQRVIQALSQIGVYVIHEYAQDQCHCGRVGRSHYRQAIENLLRARSLLRRNAA